MATNKPRITITLDPEVHATLSELAELQGRSMSSIVSELLTMVNPVQQKVLAALRNVMQVEEEAKIGLVQRLEGAHEQAQISLLPLLEMLDGFAAAAEATAAERLGAEREEGREGVAQPPHSNTGVTHPSSRTEHSPKKPSKPRKSRAPSVKASERKEGGQ